MKFFTFLFYGKHKMRFDLCRFTDANKYYYDNDNIKSANFIIWFNIDCIQQPPLVRVCNEEGIFDVVPEFNFSRRELLKTLDFFCNCDICYKEMLTDYPIKISKWICHVCYNTMCSDCKERMDKNVFDKVLKCPFCRNINLGISSISILYETKVDVFDDMERIINVYDEIDISIVIEEENRR